MPVAGYITLFGLVILMDRPSTTSWFSWLAMALIMAGRQWRRQPPQVWIG